MKLYTNVHKTECWNRTGKAPIQVRYVDINKGDARERSFHSRLVAKEMHNYKRDHLFATSPPSQAMKMVFSMVAINNKGEVIMINDVSRAFLHAKEKRDVYVALPEEGRLPGEEETCAKLNASLYGAMDAAINCHDEYSQQFASSGLIQGVASPCVLYRREWKIRTVVHGDEYVPVGMEEDLVWLESR